MLEQPELQVDIHIYKKPFPRFDRPKIIGYTGIENIKFAKKLKDRNVHYDLNILYDQVKRKPFDLDVKLNNILNILIENRARLDLPFKNHLKDATFFCLRGLMTCIACTPYESYDGWKIVVLLYKGNIFLCARDTEEKTFSKQNISEREKRFTSWGFKFEQYILSDTPTAKPNPNIPVDETKEFNLLLKSQLNHHKIVYAAEMDGIRCDKNTVQTPPTRLVSPKEMIDYLTDKEFIELKTNRHIEHRKQYENFRRNKCKKWWCQSFLVGIDTILCGYRNDNGIVEKLKTYSLRDIKEMAKGYFEPTVCFNFLDSFFTHVKCLLARKIQQKHGDSAVNNLQTLPLIGFLLEWTPGSQVKVDENYSHDDDPILTEQFMNIYCTIVE